MKEIQPWGETSYTVLNGSHCSFNTDRAAIDLITNPYYGRMLFIDGVLQSAETDEHIYHSELAALVPQQGRILIAGGAEGALAKELLSYAVDEVVMVDWDEKLVNHMKGEVFSGYAFDDPRLTVIHRDILDYLAGSETFDAILLDLLDPKTDEEVKWLSKVITLCLTKTKRLALNAGGDIGRKNLLIDLLDPNLHITSKKIFVPSFQQEWYLMAIHKR
jgi:spermidine synthase